MTIDFHDLDILSRTVWGEARGETFEGQVAVARTIVNRWKSGKWFAGKTIAETAQKPMQFSCWNAGDPNRVHILGESSESALYRSCRGAVQDALDGKYPEWLTGATHYYAPAVVAKPKWAEGHEPVGTIGGHVFYRGIK